MENDPFAALGVAVGADAAVVRAAFRRLAPRAHPDHGGSPEAFRRLVEARRDALALAPPAAAKPVRVEADQDPYRRLARALAAEPTPCRGEPARRSTFGVPPSRPAPCFADVLARAMAAAA